MDDAQAWDLYLAFAVIDSQQRVGWREDSVAAYSWECVKLSLVRILVVVASIQMRALKTEVEKGFMWTAIGHELVGPKR